MRTSELSHSLCSAFETIEVTNGLPFAFDPHWRRLVESCRRLGLTPPDEAEVRGSIARAVTAWGDEPGRLRVTITSESELVLSISSLVVPEQAATVVVADHPIDPEAPLSGSKTSWFAPNVASGATHRDYDEVLLANLSWELCEGTSSNVFVASAGRLLTPPTSSGCRAGVTRELVIRSLAASGVEVVEEPLQMACLLEVDEAFLTSTGRHVQPIESITYHDARRNLPDPGPLTSAAAVSFSALRRQLW